MLTANIYGRLARGTVILKLNFAAEFSYKKKLCSRIYSTESECYSQKNDKFAFEAPFGRLRVNVRTSPMAHWKAPGRRSIYDDRTFSLALIVGRL